MSKLKLYVDVDGTLVDTIESIVSLYNEDFANYSDFVKIDPNHINTWDFKECNCATADYINTYFNQDRFFHRLKFIDQAYEMLNKLRFRYDIVFVSHGYSPNLRAKEKWINKKLPWAKFVGVNLKYNKDKSCVDMSDGIFIDDNCNNLDSSNAAKKYCFGKEYEWNKECKHPRVETWTELYSKLMLDLEEMEKNYE